MALPLFVLSGSQLCVLEIVKTWPAAVLAVQLPGQFTLLAKKASTKHFRKFDTTLQGNKVYGTSFQITQQNIFVATWQNKSHKQLCSVLHAEPTNFSDCRLPVCGPGGGTEPAAEWRQANPLS